MKILCLASCYPPDHPGGYGLVARGFCEGLAARGHDMKVLTRRGSAGDGGPVPVQRTLMPVERGLKLTDMVRNSMRNVKCVNQYISQYKPEMILSCGSDGFGYNTYHAAMNAGVPGLTYLGDTWLTQAWRSLPGYDPLVDVASGGRKPGAGRAVKKLMGRWLKARGLLVAERPERLGPLAVISRFVLDDLRAAGAPVPAEVPILHVPLNRAFFTEQGLPLGHGGRRGPGFRALFVSRVEPLKGPDVAVAAVAQAVQRGLDARLTIAGFAADAMRQELHDQARALGIADRIDFAGTPPLVELIELYRGHDVFLFPSRIVEGLGMVNCEAQACGLPIIGTADSGAAEVIINGDTGFRVPVNDPTAMAARMLELAESPERWQRMSAMALQSACRFHPDGVLDRLERVLEAAVRA